MFKKTFFFKLVALLVLAAFVPVAIPANDPNETVTVVNSQTNDEWVVFTGTLIHTNGAEDNISSKAIDLSYLELEGATIQFISLSGTTGRDVNLFVQGSNVLADSTFESYQTRAEWDDYSTNGGGLEDAFILDRDFVKTGLWAAATASQAALSGGLQTIQSAQSDSVAYVEKDMALRCNYIRIVSDGQSGNPVTSSTKFVLRFKISPNRPSTYDFRNAIKSTT